MYLMISWMHIAELYPIAGVPNTLPYSRGLKQAARGPSLYATLVTILMINIFLKF